MSCCLLVRALLTTSKILRCRQASIPGHSQASTGQLDVVPAMHILEMHPNACKRFECMFNPKYPANTVDIRDDKTLTYKLFHDCGWTIDMCTPTHALKCLSTIIDAPPYPRTRTLKAEAPGGVLNMSHTSNSNSIPTPQGIADEILVSCKMFPLRIWVIDNSGSMSTGRICV